MAKKISNKKLFEEIRKAQKDKQFMKELNKFIRYTSRNCEDYLIKKVITIKAYKKEKTKRSERG